MTFTYSITADRGQVRLHLGDSTENKGPRPNKTNFSDAEIDYFLEKQSGSISRSVAMGLETLANEWLSYSIQEREGDLSYDAKDLADKFKKMADEWWAKPDDGTGAGSLESGLLTLDFAERGASE